MQSVFKSFFRRHAEGQFDLAGWDSLWALLTVITLKVRPQGKEYLAACRDVRREVQQTPVSRRLLRDLAGRGPRPHP